MSQIVSQGANIWTVVWSSDDPLAVGAGTDFDILFSRSTNNGVTWSAPAVLNTNALVDADVIPTLVTDGAGGLAEDIAEDLAGATTSARDRASTARKLRVDGVRVYRYHE